MTYTASNIREIRIILTNKKELIIYTDKHISVGDKYTYNNGTKDVTSTVRFTVSSPLFPKG